MGADFRLAESRNIFIGYKSVESSTGPDASQDSKVLRIIRVSLVSLVAFHIYQGISFEDLIKALPARHPISWSIRRLAKWLLHSAELVICSAEETAELQRGCTLRGYNVAGLRGNGADRIGKVLIENHFRSSNCVIRDWMRSQLML